MAVGDIWARSAIRFFSANLPGDGRGGWEHRFMTAYQIGCEALSALGHARETQGGAVPREFPALLEVLPRRDDVAVAVLYLAAQNGLIRYLPSDVDMRLASDLPALINPAHGLGLARADPEAVSVLEAIGLVKGAEWTKAAETVLWRDSPEEWSIDFVNDIRFIEAASHACERMPSSVRAEIERLVPDSDDKIEGRETQGAEFADECFGGRLVRMPKTPEEVRTTLRYDLDDLFFRLWRLDDGWLSPVEAKQALAIFHDPLAIAMRKAVMSRLFPGRP